MIDSVSNDAITTYIEVRDKTTEGIISLWAFPPTWSFAAERSTVGKQPATGKARSPMVDRRMRRTTRDDDEVGSSSLVGQVRVLLLLLLLLLLLQKYWF